jgi:hypothetical protein
MIILDKLKDIVDSVVKVEEKIGFRKVILYVFLGLLIYGVINFKTLVKDGIELVSELNEEIHNDKMDKRDEFVACMNEVLIDLRYETGADRVLYFEWHNTKENSVGVPFRYFDLVLQTEGYNIPKCLDYKDIPAGWIVELYEMIKHENTIVLCDSHNREDEKLYPISQVFFSQDGSRYQMFIGINYLSKDKMQPVGFIAIEWMDNSKEEISVDKIKSILYETNTLTIINTLIAQSI